MANLKINSNIVSEEERQFIEVIFGVDSGVSYDSIESFLEAIPADDNNINISIHCNGGEVMEGWSIYDKLRASGKEISATIEGKCASMASILLLAAPKERRYGRPNSSLLIHDPYIPFAYGQLTADELAKLSEDMQKETDKIVNTYIERTGADEQIIRDLMKEDKFIDMDKALELGFISKIIPHATAKSLNPLNNLNINKSNLMTKEVKVSKTFIDKVLAKLGYQKLEEAEKAFAAAVALELTTSNGTTLTVEREEGDPQVGDKATPDGTHEMPDGKTIKVENGEITEITEPNPEVDALKAKVAELESLLKMANDSIDNYKANAISDAQKAVLDKVTALGGIEKLRTIASNYVPPVRSLQTATNVDRVKNQGEKKDPFRERINQLEAKHQN